MDYTKLRSEEDEIREARKSRNRSIRRFIGCSVSTILFFFLMCAAPFLNARRSAWETQARDTLRSIGQAQMAHRSNYDTQSYASFTELQNEDYIVEGYSLGNLTDNYFLTMEIFENPDDPNDIGRFTVIAYPRDTRKGYLRTFAISEDQVVRVYEPGWHHIKWESVKTWDPIL